MARKVAISVSAVASLLAHYYPDPDDSDPIGPWGPIIREFVRYAMLAGPGPEPWVGGSNAGLNFGPQPEPWRALGRIAANYSPPNSASATAALRGGGFRVEGWMSQKLAQLLVIESTRIVKSAEVEGDDKYAKTLAIVREWVSQYATFASGKESQYAELFKHYGPMALPYIRPELKPYPQPWPLPIPWPFPWPFPIPIPFPWPPPPPDPRGELYILPIDVLTAGVVFAQAADAFAEGPFADGNLADLFGSVADELLGVASERLG